MDSSPGSRRSGVPIEATLACPSCGARPMGRYCGQCGEKRRLNQNFSIRHYLTEAIETFTHFDSKILRTAWRLVAHPGALSADYLAGRRIRYINPLRLFLLFSVLYYFSNSIFPYNAFTTPLATQLHLNDYYPAFAARRVADAMQGLGIEYPAFERAYNEMTAILSKTLLFSVIPVIALLLRVYRVSRWYSGLLAVAVAWSFFQIVWLFWLLLFVVTLNSL